MRYSPRGLWAGLSIATLVAGAMRLYRLGEVPVSLYCDEAFSAYEAWCLLLTGRDSRGVAFPFVFDIFGKGWGEPLHIYFSVPAVALLGLTPVAARLVAAVAGTLAVPLTGLLTRALVRFASGRLDAERSARLADAAGIGAAVLMSFSPWSFHLSRVAFQASLLPATLAAAFWLATLGLGRRDGGGPDRAVRPTLLAGSAIALGISLYTYTVARLAVPLLAAGFVIANRRRLATMPRAAVGAGLLLAIIALPILGFSMTERGRQRFSDVSLLSDPAIRSSGPAAVAAAAAGNYVSYYTPRFLFLEGDPNPRHSIRGHGILHPHEAILLVCGVVACLALRGPGPAFLLWWFLAYPVAAALTIDARHAVRAIAGQPAVYAIAGMGIAVIWEGHRTLATTRRRALSVLLMCLMAGASAVATAAYCRDYFVDYPRESGPAWQYGLQEVYEYVEAASEGHDSIYVTRNEDFPYIHLLFYRAFPPEEYQAHGFSRTKYLFDEDVFYRGPALPRRANPIFVLKPWELPEGLQARHTVRYPDGTDAFVIAW